MDITQEEKKIYLALKGWRISRSDPDGHMIKSESTSSGRRVNYLCEINKAYEQEISNFISSDD